MFSAYKKLRNPSNYLGHRPIAYDRYFHIQYCLRCYYVRIKGLIMDRCVLTSTPEWVVTPRRAITRAQPEWSPRGETTWCWQFPSLSTNIMLIKSKLKLESRAIVVGVAMSPRNLGGKFRCRPHPRWRKCTRQFFPGTRACQSNCMRVASSLAWRQHRRSCGVFKSWIYVAHCPLQRKWRVLHIRYISVLFNCLCCWQILGIVCS